MDEDNGNEAKQANASLHLLLTKEASCAHPKHPPKVQNTLHETLQAAVVHANKNNEEKHDHWSLAHSKR